MTASLPLVLDYPLAAPPAPGEVIEVAPRIHWLRMPLPFALDHINLWLLREDDGYTLVDCGYGDAATRAVWERHFATTLAQHPIRRIIATHCHPDHVGNAEWLSSRFGVAVAKALAAPPVAAEWCLALVRPGGAAVLWVGPSADASAIARAARRLNAELEPSSPGFVVLRKLGPTPSGFPRRAGIARKRPLG